MRVRCLDLIDRLTISGADSFAEGLTGERRNSQRRDSGRHQFHLVAAFAVVGDSFIAIDLVSSGRWPLPVRSNAVETIPAATVS